MTVRPDSIEEVCAAVKAHRCVLPSGGGTKPALSQLPDGVTGLDMLGLTGMIEYEPDEFTFTALAGTPLSVVQAAVHAHGQYLPFDPPLAAQGATLGGTVAAGLSGPGRMRFGGVRDFIIGVRWVDGDGGLIRGGGKVVKNAAGFDFPKLFTGSMGRLGVLVELSFKVFPHAASYITCAIECRDIADAVDRLCFLCAQSWEVDALELTVSGAAPQLFVRFAGDEPALTARGEAVLAATGRPGRILSSGESQPFWDGLASLNIAPPNAPLARVPLTPSRIPALEAALAGTNTVRHYTIAGNAALISGMESDALSTILQRQGLSGFMIRGTGLHRIGIRPSAAMEAKVKAAMDPNGKFPNL
ncbi:MAG TPA: FAD-binding protein [Verrucomicrobiales bacterium]|nr:FAD-binding protein [Verrucomicrobiales bacterium]